MKRFLPSVALLAAAVLARADVVVVQKIDGGGQSGEQTIRVKGGKARCDIGGAVSVIFDRETGETTTLSHAQRGTVTLSPEANRAMLEKMQKARGSTEPPALIPTGKKEKIGEYQCEIFTAELGNVKVTYWLAKDFPQLQTFLSHLDVLESSPLAGAKGGVAPRTKDLPGMPIKVLMDMGGQKVTVTTLSAKEENVDPSIFKIPAGYKDLPSPPAP
ncbi:MAG: DUF4412 domain-containing protein [Chthoniobacteraceae bacterium]